jgi:hypothetical protein
VNKKGERKMKKQAYTIIALVVLVGSMTVAAQAQNSGRAEMHVFIPFEFNVGEKNMPVGEYIVSRINPAVGVVVLQLRNAKGSALVPMNNVKAKTSGKARLTFNCYGSRRYFAEAWTSGETSGLRGMPGRSEREARNESASSNRTTQTVALRPR